MYIKELKLENFRSAKKMELELDEKINVFVGINGSGKTTILDASAILLSWLTNRIKSINASGRQILEDDIHNNTSYSLLTIALKQLENECWWSLSKTKKGRAKRESNLGETRQYAQYLQEKIEKSNGEINLPLFVYYPIDRVVHEIPLRIRNHHNFDTVDAYDNALTTGANFRTFFEWFRNREDIENEENIRAFGDSDGFSQLFTKGFARRDMQLETVRNAIYALMPHFSNLRIQRKPKLSMIVTKNAKEIAVNQLSDGEKCLFALIGDLARRLAIANPMRENPLEGEGVVLIDEIDLHLHPMWQQMIVPQLLKTFPNCQFLISTHSPHVLTHVTSDKVFLLENTQMGLDVLRPREMYGKTSESILKSFMGLETTRPKVVTNELHQIFIDIQEKELTKAQKRIDKLMELIGDDPELVKARALIRRMGSIGK